MEVLDGMGAITALGERYEGIPYRLVLSDVGGQKRAAGTVLIEKENSFDISMAMNEDADRVLYLEDGRCVRFKVTCQAAPFGDVEIEVIGSLPPG